MDQLTCCLADCEQIQGSGYATQLAATGVVGGLQSVGQQLSAPPAVQERIETLAAAIKPEAQEAAWGQEDSDAVRQALEAAEARRSEALLYSSTLAMLHHLHSEGSGEALERALLLLPRAISAWQRAAQPVGDGPFAAWGASLREHLCWRANAGLTEAEVLTRVDALVAIGDAWDNKFRAHAHVDYIQMPAGLVTHDNRGMGRPGAVELRERVRGLIPDPWGEAQRWLEALPDTDGFVRLWLRRGDAAMARAVFIAGLSRGERSGGLQRAVQCYRRAADGGGGLAAHQGCLQVNVPVCSSAKHSEAWARRHDTSWVI